MGIFAKLTQIAENMEEVHEAGYNKGKAVGYKEGQDAGGYTEGFEAGKKAEHDAFWEAFQSPSRRTWENVFQGEGWNDDTFYPKHDIVPTGSAGSLFRYSCITDLEGRLNECGVKLDTSKATSLNNIFVQSALTVIPVVDMTGCTATNAINGAFAGCTSLKTIRGIKINPNVLSSKVDTFNNCPMLEDVSFEGEIGLSLDFKLSTKLTSASIESIINHLSDTATGNTLTLSKTAVMNAFGGAAVDTDGDGVLDAIMGSEEWLKLAGNKTNWNFAFV